MVLLAPALLRAGRAYRSGRWQDEGERFSLRFTTIFR
jgi:hypothetical protein